MATNNYTSSRLFFSNCLENLFNKLQENVFPINSFPLDKRIVIVPSLSLERWICKKFAENLGIAAGIETYFLEESISKLFHTPPPLTRLQLIINLEEKICFLQDKWPQLKKYIGEKRKRSLSLAKILATLFLRYSVYGNNKCGEWEKNPSSWQEDLWREVVSTWHYPIDCLSSLRPKNNEGIIHLFGFSHIPPLYFYFFKNLGSYFYQLSCCQEFWSDMTNSHPILTYLGRVGREMARLVEESDIITEELYETTDNENQLNSLQRELLFLCEEDKKHDATIQLHVAQTAHHEIEILHKNLVTLLNEDSFLEPKDIIVMAPDISLYEPFISAIFTKSIPYNIEKDSLIDPELEALFLLISLEKKRFNAKAVILLFSHPLFMKKMGWGSDQLEQITKWVVDTDIRWGLNAKHRDDLLKKRLCKNEIEDDTATWERGINILFEELAKSNSHYRINFSQAELLGEWKSVLDDLTSDIKIFSEELTLDQWSKKLLELHKKYFFSSENIRFYLDQIKGSGSLYSLECVQTLLEELVSNKGIINTSVVQAVNFCSMLPMRAIPAKIICLIGMNHDSFPRREFLENLDMLKNGGGDYAPSRVDFDRYLFLEVLLSAREKLIISYLGVDPFDHSELPPSPIVTQLMPYISHKYKHTLWSSAKHIKKQPQIFFSPRPVEITRENIDVKDFVRVFKSPLRHYLYHRNIVMREERFIQEEEIWNFSKLRLSLLRTKELSDIRKKSDFPVGSLGMAASYQLEKEKKLLPKNLCSQEINISVGEVQISGTLDGVYDEGLCTLDKKTASSIVCAWPKFLLLTAHNKESSSLLFAREGKKVSRFFDDPYPLLNEAIRYYFLSKKVLSPLFPSCVRPILQNEAEELEKALKDDFSMTQSLINHNDLDHNKIIAEWRGEAEILFAEMFNAWL